MNDLELKTAPDENAFAEQAEEECPVCLAKTIALESLPYLADLLRNAASSNLQKFEDGEDVETELMLNAITNIRQSIEQVSEVVELLKKCDCGGDEEEPKPSPEEVDEDYLKQYREYDV